MVRRYDIYGLDYVGGSFHQVVDFIEEAHNDKAACLIGFAPMTSAAEAVKNERYRDILNSFDIVTMDGASIVRQVEDYKYYGIERCSGPDVMAEIMHRTANTSVRHFLYGTDEDTLLALKSKLEEQGNLIVGTMAPPYMSFQEWEQKNWRDDAFYNKAREAKADCVWVALGAPKQEYFCMAAKQELPGVKMFAVGAAFNFLSGKIARAPKIWQKCGMEWLWRMFHEPHQISRYVCNYIALKKGRRNDYGPNKKVCVER